MSSSSKIEWTDATWNPVTGCTKVSPGCAHCYAETFAERWRGTEGHPYENGFDLTLRPERLDQPKHWRKPRMIFVNSMSDLFHEEIPADFIAQVYETMVLTPQHIYQVLTKRPDQLRNLSEFSVTGDHINGPEYDNGPITEAVYESPHIWHGVSVESDLWAACRIPDLIAVPTGVRFLSCEPLLGNLDLSRWLDHIDWVIVGGESGPKARPMHPDWVRGIREQCALFDVPFFFKQWGALAPVDQLDTPVAANEQHFGLDYARIGKSKTGAKLDGREYRAMPANDDHVV